MGKPQKVSIFRRAVRVVRAWVAGVFDLKDVWDLLIQGVNVVASGNLVSWVSALWSTAPAALQVVYAVGVFMTTFGLVSLVKGRVRGTVPALRHATERRPKEGVLAVPHREAKAVVGAEPVVEPQGPPFYEDQAAMLADNWGIKRALADPDVEKMCLAFESGHFYNGLLDEVVKQKVSRVTLALPGSKWLNDLYHDKPHRLGPATENIRTAWKKSKKNGVDVVLVECPSIHCVIAYKSDGGGWARAQLALTSEETDYWPSFVADRIQQPELFRRIEDSFGRQFSLGLDEWPADQGELKGVDEEPPAELPMPTADSADLDAIQDFRTLWNRHGVKAAEAIQSLFSGVKAQLRDGGVYWEGLLQSEVEQLEDAIKAMDKAVEIDTLLSANMVQESFNAFYVAYLNACKWVARVDASGDVSLDDGSVLAKKFETWERTHYRFRDKLLDMNEKPFHKGTLNIFSTAPEETLLRFLSRAESDQPEESSSVRHELQAMSYDVRGSVEGAQAVLEALGHLLSGDESKNEVEQGRGSLDTLTLGLDSGESAEHLQDLLHCLYIDYQRMRGWIAKCIQRGGALIPGEGDDEVGETVFAWSEADRLFLETLDRLLQTDAFARLAYHLRLYDGPNPTFGIVKQPPPRGLSAGKLGFGLVGGDTTMPSSSDTEVRPSPGSAEGDPET